MVALTWPLAFLTLTTRQSPEADVSTTESRGPTVAGNILEIQFNVRVTNVRGFRKRPPR